MRKVEILHTGNPPDIGYFHQFNMNGAVVELIDGTFQTFPASYIQFLDSPEDEQRAEFAKAAMQGILASNECGVGHNPSTASSWAVSIAEALISELKKQKP